MHLRVIALWLLIVSIAGHALVPTDLSDGSLGSAFSASSTEVSLPAVHGQGKKQLHALRGGAPGDSGCTPDLHFAASFDPAEVVPAFAGIPHPSPLLHRSRELENGLSPFAPRGPPLV